jgi:poly(3-hydroxybutyrate) depolymerase
VPVLSSCPPVAASLQPAPALTRRLVESGSETWWAAVNGGLEYWTGALQRGATPLDVAGDASRWWQATTGRRRPEWASPHRVVMESEVVRLRDFSSSTGTIVPTLVFPPQAGHDSCIVDYSSNQSQLKTMQAAGLTRLYSLDWVGATEETSRAGISDYLEFVERAIDDMGAPVNLVGDCQGGWLAAIYAALHPEQVNTLTLAGAPIDFHAGEPVIHDYVELLSPLDLSFYEGVVRLGGGVMKGEFMLGGFITIKPENELAKQLQLLASIRDEAHVSRYRAFEDWFKHTQDIPGAFYLWIVEHLFRDNALIEGTLDVEGQRVNLGDITAPLFLLAGGSDHITPPPQVFAAERAVSTPAKDVVKRVTSGGHLGLFMGREALRDHWPPILAEVCERSKPRAAKGSARRRAKAAAPKPTKPIPAP